MENFWQSLVQYITPETAKFVLKLGIILVLGFVGGKLINKAIEQFINKTVSAGQQRRDTLIQIFNGIAFVGIWVIVGLTLLSQVGINIGPLLTAAGVAGVALGFGGQYLIRDLIAGLFIILENQYRVGDVVCLDDSCGLVEKISMRMSTLRDLDGTVHHVPHGEIKKVSNLSKGYARVNLNLGVAYDSDLEKVIRVVNKVGKDLAKDKTWSDVIISPPQFLRVDEFADSAIIIKILGDTKPIKQWDVTGELRKRLKIAFDKEKIVIPFPQRVIHTK